MLVQFWLAKAYFENLSSDPIGKHCWVDLIFLIPDNMLNSSQEPPEEYIPPFLASLSTCYSSSSPPFIVKMSPFILKATFISFLFLLFPSISMSISFFQTYTPIGFECNQSSLLFSLSMHPFSFLFIFSIFFQSKLRPVLSFYCVQSRNVDWI